MAGARTPGDHTRAALTAWYAVEVLAAAIYLTMVVNRLLNRVVGYI
jgi:hypothetical protein